jgi:hypothetical protein
VLRLRRRSRWDIARSPRWPVTISVTALATSSGRHRLPKFVGKAIRSQRDSSNHPRQTLPPALATDAAVVIPETARRVAPLIQRCQNLSREFSRFVENHRGRFHRRALVSAEFGKVGKPSAFGQNKQGRSRVLKGGSANIASTSPLLSSVQHYRPSLVFVTHFSSTRHD